MEHRISYWEQTSILEPANIAIIGSGIVGLTAAITLRKTRPDLSVMVVDRGVAPIGASTRNAGFACFGSLSEIVADINSMGYDQAIALIKRRKAGLDRLFALTGVDSIDYVRQGGFEVFLDADEPIYEACVPWLERINSDVEEVFGHDFLSPLQPDELPQGLNFTRVVAHKYEGQLHPGKMVLTLLRKANELGVRFLNGVQVEGVDDQNGRVRVKTAFRDLAADRVLFATNGFIKQLLPDLSISPARNQVLLSEPLESIPLRGCYHYKEGYVYFRDVGNRLLIGGARHLDKAGESVDSFGMTELITDWLKNFVHKYILGKEVVFTHAWSGILGVGTSKDPIIKMVSPRVGVAVRMGGMGVAIGALVGEEAANLIAESV